jgi:hypothetical protein
MRCQVNIWTFFLSKGGFLIISRQKTWIIGSGRVFTGRLYFQSPISELYEAVQILHYQSALNFNGLDAIPLEISDFLDSQESVCVLSPATLNESEGYKDTLEIPVKVLEVLDAPDMITPCCLN